MPKYSALTIPIASLALLATLAITPPGQIASWGAKAWAGSAVIGGRRMTCGTGKIIINNKMKAIGRASPGRREIYLNKRLLSRYGRQFQQWVFLHECAHMYISDEIKADCWALRRGLYRGLFTSRTVDQVCKSLWNTASGIYHFAGPDRCIHLRTCLKQTRTKLIRKSNRKQ